MHLTLAQTGTWTATLAAAWLMVRSGEAKRLLKVKAPRRCPACGRLRLRNGCSCTEQ